MKFCSHCGSSNMVMKTPVGDHRRRFTCDDCGAIHYQNPRVIAGCLIEQDEKVLLLRREIAPQAGLWNLPAGFLENGETVREGAMRETREEAMAEVDLQYLHVVYNLPQFHQVYLIYYGALPQGRFGAGEETLEARFFAKSEIPWDEIAFESTKYALEKWLSRKPGDRQVYEGSLSLK
ncbi:NUDIX hydrolase [Persicobacter psychrovividus]